MKNTRKKVDVEETPTTILTQLGPMSALPKLGRGETSPNYKKSHDKKTKTA